MHAENGIQRMRQRLAAKARKEMSKHLDAERGHCAIREGWRCLPGDDEPSATPLFGKLSFVQKVVCTAQGEARQTHGDVTFMFCSTQVTLIWQGLHSAATVGICPRRRSLQPWRLSSPEVNRMNIITASRDP